MVEQLFRKGSEGPEVKRIQEKLDELSYYPGPVDGSFGPETELAVKSFQEAKHLTADGIVGPQTRNLLFSPFQLNNYSKHVGTRGEYEWFQWKVFVDEPENNLEKISYVEYRLHETFPNRIRIVEDRTTKFALESAGWGEFWIFVTIYLSDRTEAQTQYYLDLGKSWPPDDR